MVASGRTIVTTGTQVSDSVAGEQLFASADGGAALRPAALRTDGGQVWTPVTVPTGHGAGTGIIGLAADSAGLIAVRPGTTGDGVTYFPQQVTVQDDRVVALGTQTRDGVTTPVAELSTDDGATWRQVPAIR